MLSLDTLVAPEALRRLPVSGQARRVLPALVEFPLASASDLSALMGRNPPYFYSSLWELHSVGLVASSSLGATRPRTIRWWVTPSGLEELGLNGLAWHQPWALSQLLKPAAVGGVVLHCRRRSRFFPALGVLGFLPVVQRPVVGRCRSLREGLGGLYLERAASG